MSHEAAERARATLADAGAKGWLHATRIGDAEHLGVREVAVDADDAVPMASVYKLPLAAVWADLADAGEVDPATVVEATVEHRTPGPTGLSLLCDPVRISMRDLVVLMLTLSDNAAGDIVLAAVTTEAVNDAMARLGLVDTRVRHGTAEAQQRVQWDTGTRSLEASTLALADLHRDVTTAEYDPALASYTTARDMTRLLDLLWTRKLAPGPAGALVRHAMTRQVSQQRLASGFPHDDVTVAGKTGTLGILRHEVGVVSFPHEDPVAVAVFTRSVRAETKLPSVDRAIGEASRIAVHHLRGLR